MENNKILGVKGPGVMASAKDLNTAIKVADKNRSKGEQTIFDPSTNKTLGSIMQDGKRRGSIAFFDEDSIKPQFTQRRDALTGLYGLPESYKIDFKNRNTHPSDPNRNHGKWAEDDINLYDLTEAVRKEYARQFGDKADLLKEGLDSYSSYVDRQGRRDFLNDYLRHHLGQSYDDQADEMRRFSSHYFNLPDEADENFESWKKDYDEHVRKYAPSKQPEFNDREKEYLKRLGSLPFKPEATLRMFNKKRQELGEPLLNLADFGYKE